MSLFDKILVPLDGSRSAARALDAAIAIAKKFNGKITLIHVYSVGILTTTLTSEVEESMLPPSGNSLPPSEVYRACMLGHNRHTMISNKFRRNAYLTKRGNNNSVMDEK